MCHSEILLQKSYDHHRPLLGISFPTITTHMADSVHKIEFQVAGNSNGPRLIRYKLPHSREWVLIGNEYQVIEAHKILLEDSSFLQAMETTKCKRNFMVKFTLKEARPYFERKFIKSKVEEKNESHAHSTTTECKSLLVDTLQGNVGNSKTLREMIPMEQSRPRRMKLSKFNGKCDPIIWMKIYEKVCEFNHWTTDEAKIYGLHANLQGNALKWYNSSMHEGIEESWDIWKNSFLDCFHQPMGAALTAALDYEYRGGDLMDYFFEKQRLLQLVLRNPDELQYIIMMLMGLPKYMEDMLVNLTIDTREQLLKAMKTYRHRDPETGALIVHPKPSSLKSRKQEESEKNPN